MHSTFFSGIEIEGATIGLAFVGTMCDRQQSTGFTQDGGNLGELDNVIATVAHELGHIFNMNHDDGKF